MEEKANTELKGRGLKNRRYENHLEHSSKSLKKPELDSFSGIPGQVILFKRLYFRILSFHQTKNRI